MHRSSPCAIVARFNPYDRKSPSTFISLKYDKLVHSTFNQAKFTLIPDLPIYYQPRGKLSSQKCSTIITHTSRWLETDLFELFSTLKWLSLYLQGSELSSQQQAEVVKSGSNHQRLLPSGRLGDQDYPLATSIKEVKCCSGSIYRSKFYKLQQLKNFLSARWQDKTHPGFSDRFAPCPSCGRFSAFGTGSTQRRLSTSTATATSEKPSTCPASRSETWVTKEFCEMVASEGKLTNT